MILKQPNMGASFHKLWLLRRLGNQYDLVTQDNRMLNYVQTETAESRSNIATSPSDGTIVVEGRSPSPRHVTCSQRVNYRPNISGETPEAGVGGGAIGVADVSMMRWENFVSNHNINRT